MAEKSYPQIPTTVWWGVRALLQRSPTAKYDEGMLAASLNVQLVAARQYLKQFVSVGILDEEGKLTELGGKWRLDDQYREAVDEIVERVYDESLATIAAPGSVDRNVAKNWFMNQGLGEGSARNKAATYALISSPSPGAQEYSLPSSARTSSEETKPKKKKKTVNKVSRLKPSSESSIKRSSEQFPLNVNVQIHISADATTDQIDSIFRSMRQHLYDE